MEPIHDQPWEFSLEQLARRFEYPPTPDIAAAAGQPTTDSGPRTEERQEPGYRPRPPATRRLAWGMALILLMAAVTLAIPQTRAAVLSLFARVGAIDIFIDEAAPTPPPASTPAPTATNQDRVGHSLALFELGEPVGLDEARRRADFPLALPTALGEPDDVYAHRHIDLPAVTFVWREESGALLSLTEIGAGAFALKMVAEEAVSWVEVDGQEAAWLEGPHRLQLLGYSNPNSLWIESNVLIWMAGDITYRLEGDLSDGAMIAIAESIEN